MAPSEIAYKFLYAFHSNYCYLVSFPRQSKILVENLDFFHISPAFVASVGGGGARRNMAITLVWTN